MRRQTNGKTDRTIGMRFGLLALPAALAASIVAHTPPASAQANQQIVVTVETVKPLDRFDAASKADLYARVTIAGETKSSPVIKQTGTPGQTIRVDLTVSKSVAAGTHPVKLELLDKDLAADDLIDINSIDKRRVLEFTVNTRTCRIEGFSTTYRCKSKIVRTGKEPKKAEVMFTVDVKK